MNMRFSSLNSLCRKLLNASSFVLSAKVCDSSFSTGGAEEEDVGEEGEEGGGEEEEEELILSNFFHF